MTRHTLTRLLAVAFGVAALSACGSASSATARPSFDDQAGATVSCLVHQSRRPTPLYLTGPREDTFAILQMLRYYTQNGTKPYCDGRRATAVDRAWATRYVQLGADPSRVQPIVDDR